MTDDPRDLTQPIETPAVEPEPAAAATTPDAATAPTGPASTVETATDAESVTGAIVTEGPEAAPTQAVSAPGAARVSRRRWLVGLGVAALALVLAGVGLVVLGSPSTPEALQYIPADSAMVAELRLDLPGDQLQHTGNFLAHFPGFKDQSILGDKINEALERLVGDASHGSVSYARDVKPLVAGPSFFALRSITMGQDLTTKASYLISLTTDGTVDCAKVFQGRQTTSSTYRSVQISDAGDGQNACAIDGKHALVGDPETVKLALDAHADGKGIDRDADYAAARSSLRGDHLATIFVSFSDFLRLSQAMNQGLGVPVPSLPPAGQLPAWEIIGLRIEDDALVAEAVAPQPVAPASPAASLLTSAPQHDSRLAAEVPGDAIFYAEVQDAGVALQNLLTVLRSNPETQASIQQIDSALNALGGTSQLVGWVHDAGFVFGTEGSTIEGALLLEGADAADAQSHERQLEGLLHLAGPSTGLTIGETTVEGTRVVTIDLPPTGSTGKLTIPNQIAIAVHDRVLLIALGQESIRRLVTLQASGSLAQAGAFRHAASRSFPIHGGTAYFNVSALASLAESLSTPDELATYQQNVKPYIAPLEAFLATFQNDGSLGRARLVMTVVTPTQ